MACEGCGETPIDGPREEMRVFSFPFGPRSGIEVRTWGVFTATQAVLASQWVEKMLQAILLEIPPRELEASR